MPLTPTAEIVAAAVQRGEGVAAFNVITLEHAEAIVRGAESAGRPVILQISENCARYHGALAPLSAATLAIAGVATVPVAVHLDHVTDVDLVRAALEIGFESVMFDASAMDYAANVAVTSAVVAECHARGIWVEAELGEVGGKDGVHAPGARTDPDEALVFVRDTRVDALAVAVGSSHAMVTRDATLDYDLIAALRAQVGLPLVLHGSSGVSDEGLSQAIRQGIVKVNIGTQLNKVFTAEVRGQLGANPETHDPRRYLGAARDAVSAEVARLLAVLERA